MPDLLYAAVRRREWVAALRWLAHEYRHSRGADSEDMRNEADRIESGALTPWADDTEPATAPDPTHGRVDRDIQAAVNDWEPTSLGQRVAIENTLQEQRDAGREPLTPPAEPAATPPADPDPHPDTPPHASGILGRAWLDRDGSVWRTPSDVSPPGHEVLLVDPAAWEQRERVIGLVQEWRAGHGPQRHCGHCDMVLTWTEAVCGNCGQDEVVLVDMAAAVDALTGGPDNPTNQDSGESPPSSDGGPDPAVIRLADGVHWLGEVASEDSHSLTDHARLPPGPEPTGDGPGWQRDEIGYLATLLDRAEAGRLGDPPQRQPGDQLRALLAERDRLRDLLGDSIDPATIPEQRAKNWTDWHPETYCHRCGHRNLWSWYADNAVWNEAQADEGGILCPVCFVSDHERTTGTWTTWRLAPADKSDEAGHLVRSEAAMRHERDVARAELATARRDTAAATLDAFAVHVRGSGLTPLAIVAERWAAEIRTGQRDTPGTEPDGGQHG